MADITITVSGPVGSGKSALLGEIEVLMRALGVPVRYADPMSAESEKRMTGADWTAYIEMYQPSVVLVEAPPAASEPSEATDAMIDTAFLTDVASENAAARARLMAALERERANLRADDALRLQTLIERRTGAK